VKSSSNRKSLKFISVLLTHASQSSCRNLIASLLKITRSLEQTRSRYSRSRMPMTSIDLMNGLGTIVAAATLSLLCAHRHPDVYLRARDGVTLSIHALALGFIFGIGVIIGRYGFEGAVIKPTWMALHLTLVITLYMGALTYHRVLCAIAEKGPDGFAQQRAGSR
jgi:hypothetical protein